VIADLRARGLVLTTLGVLILTPDGLLVRLAAMEPLSLTVLRGLFQALGGVLLVLVLRRGATLQSFRALRRSGVWMAALVGLGNLLFVLAVDRTAVANVLVLIAIIPLFAAALGWLWLGEVLPRRTWIAIVLALAGVAVVAAGSVGRPTVLGDMAAMLAALCNAAFFVLVRKRPEVDRVPTVALAGLTSAVLAVAAAFLLGQDLDLAGVGMHQLRWIMLMGLVVLPLSFGCILSGPRYLPAAEVGLVMLLEAVLGPLWVWLVLSEQPPNATLLGGAMILATLAWHSFGARRR
jgi:drug/metabolite transporter (DMT)-like permease